MGCNGTQGRTLNPSSDEKPMLVAAAHIKTDRASRHLAQLCRHAGKMREHRSGLGSRGDREHMPPEVLHVECSDADGIISFGWGRCTLQASPAELTMRVEAPDEEKLLRLQDLIAYRLQAIGSRDAIVVRWQRLDNPRSLELNS